MLPYATPAICAQLDPYEERERDTLRTRSRQQLGSPARAGAQIALAICEVEAGLRSPLQLEQLCHLTPVAQAVGAAAPVGWAGGAGREPGPGHRPRAHPGAGRGHRVHPPWRSGGAGAMRLDGAKGRWELVELQY
jgi:hypothetical protein